MTNPKDSNDNSESGRIHQSMLQVADRWSSLSSMSTFHERKSARKDYFFRFIAGWKEQPCTACSGSGHYDHDGSPACGGCDGTRKERVRPVTPPGPNHFPLVRTDTRSANLQAMVRYYAQPGIHIAKYRTDLDWLGPLVVEERERMRKEAAEAWAARRAPVPRM